MPAVTIDVNDHPLMRTLGILLAVIRLMEQVPTLGPTAIRILRLYWLFPPTLCYRGLGPEKKISTTEFFLSRSKTGETLPLRKNRIGPE